MIVFALGRLDIGCLGYSQRGALFFLPTRSGAGRIDTDRLTLVFLPDDGLVFFTGVTNTLLLRDGVGGAVF